MTFWPSLIGYQLVWFAAVIGASIGQIGTAVGQQSLRAVLGLTD